MERLIASLNCKLVSYFFLVNFITFLHFSCSSSSSLRFCYRSMSSRYRSSVSYSFSGAGIVTKRRKSLSGISTNVSGDRREMDLTVLTRTVWTGWRLPSVNTSTNNWTISLTACWQSSSASVWGGQIVSLLNPPRLVRVRWQIPVQPLSMNYMIRCQCRICRGGVN